MPGNFPNHFFIALHLFDCSAFHRMSDPLFCRYNTDFEVAEFRCRYARSRRFTFTRRSRRCLFTRSVTAAAWSWWAFVCYNRWLVYSWWLVYSRNLRLMWWYDRRLCSWLRCNVITRRYCRTTLLFTRSALTWYRWTLSWNLILSSITRCTFDKPIFLNCS